MSWQLKYSLRTRHRTNRIFMGLKNGPSVGHNVTKKLCREIQEHMINAEIMSHVDNIVICSTNETDHFANMHTTLKYFKHYNYQISSKEFLALTTKCKILSHNITDTTISPARAFNDLIDRAESINEIERIIYSIRFFSSSIINFEPRVVEIKKDLDEKNIDKSKTN